MATSNNWVAQDSESAEHVGIIEFEDPREDGEYIHFTVLKTETHFLFGGVCNTGFLESGNYVKDKYFSDDENLQQLIEDLESFYRDGDGYQTDNFSHNDRM
ncbi:hypothetical protein [Photobacterium kishitanii]|uniref:Uncharacterized protein n=1 Tax=Photobacterium kishitanii TaxID=318456 RepID=A0A2T3KLF7_9GAMM|nr:hypothetical protein [Photobacterium kishitanii]PSV00506.1 hypothetical protein C9J27_05060 [Photobacterium kishitanii]